MRAGSPLRADHILRQKHLWPVLSPRALWVALIPTPTQEPSYSALPLNLACRVFPRQAEAGVW